MEYRKGDRVEVLKVWAFGCNSRWTAGYDFLRTERNPITGTPEFVLRNISNDAESRWPESHVRGELPPGDDGEPTHAVKGFA